MTLITPDELVALRQTGAGVCLLDVRWRLDEPEGRPAYLDGHIPGAIYVDLEAELAERPDPQWGRHPLPTHRRLQRAARRWGLQPDDIVVIYDDLQSVAAARAWWLLVNSSVADVRILDGGLRAWLAAGYDLVTGDAQPPPGTAILSPLTAPIVGIDRVDPPAPGTILLDVRAPERYRGAPATGERVSGHIPGAINLPTTTHLDAGRFRSPEVISRLFAAQGIGAQTQAIAYCGSGIAATHTIFAGWLIGLDIALFPGGWSQWQHARGRWAVEGDAADGTRTRI
ncbi:sulfurtransferase [Microbacterium sp. NC79]|uniref:sulfurtransferase n=1 Tax=Microbacterium sp. NC79 TaxID=2851009 RepID=UPI00349FC4DE